MDKKEDENTKAVICQSCGMPMMAKEHFGTNEDGSTNDEYCCFCLHEGKFTKDVSANEYAEMLVSWNKNTNLPNNLCHTLSDDELIIMETVRLQKLKRWQHSHEITHQNYYKSIYSVMEYIDKHLPEQITTLDLARVGNISEFHFHRLFKAVLNETPNDYIQRLRMEKAAFLLRNTSGSLADIAMKVGYQNIYSLSKIFKITYGVSPGSYRNKAVEFKIQESKPIINLNLTPKIVSIPSMKLICLRVANPFKHQKAYKSAWSELLNFTELTGIPDNAHEYFSISYDLWPLTAPEKYRIFACIHSKETDAIKPEGKFCNKTIEGGLYAVFKHEGAYDDLNYTYCNIYRYWLPKSDYELRDMLHFEKYLNSPDAVNADNLITEIYIPVQKLANKNLPKNTLNSYVNLGKPY